MLHEADDLGIKRALRTGLLEYDRRHGYRGPVAKIELANGSNPVDWGAELEEYPLIGGLRPAVVQSVDARSARIYVKDLGVVNLPWEKLSWARRELPEEKVDRAPTRAADILSPGDVIYTVGSTVEKLQFVQVPEAQSALVTGPTARIVCTSGAPLTEIGTSPIPKA